MKTLIQKICFAALTILFAWICTPSILPASDFKEKDPGQVTAAVPRNFPPLYMTDENGRPQGFAIDIMDSVAALSGLEVSYLAKNTWKEVNDAILSGQADLIPNNGITQERKNLFDFTLPIETFPVSIFVRNNSTGINNIEDLAGHRVGVVRTNIAVTLLEEHEEISPVSFNNPQDAVFALLSGNIDALVYPAPVIHKLLREARIDNRLKTAGKPLIEMKRAIAVAKGNPELVSRLDAVLAEFVESDEYRRIYIKWYGEPLPFWTNKTVFFALIGIAAFIFLVMLLWRYFSLSKINAMLGEQVRKEQHVSQILRVVRNVSQLIVKEKNTTTLIQETCNNLVETRGYESAWIILFEPFRNNKDHLFESLKLVSHAQKGTGPYYDNLLERIKKGETFACVQQALTAPGLFIIHESRSECRQCPFFELPHTRSGIMAMLKHEDWIYGLICIAQDEDFNEHLEEHELFKEIVSDISFALHNLELEKKQQRILKEKDNIESRLQRAQKMEAIGTLAGGIAHDFNNILVPIMGYAELMMDEVDKDSRLRGQIDKILLSSNRAKELIKQILTFCRQTENTLLPIKIQPVVKESLRLLRSTLPSTIEMHQHIDGSCGSINGDPTQIQQIIMNLCTNAYHAMEDTGGTIEVALTPADPADLMQYPDIPPGDYLKLKVSDTGHGMNQELLDRIFEPYFTTKEQGKGTGLGLSIVLGIVQSHGGSIKVRSTPGRGTTFCIYLPVITYPETEEIAMPEILHQRGSEHILYVDDEEQIVQMGRAMLEHQGYRVTAMTNSLEALEAFRQHPDHYDLLITDMTMPGLTGVQLGQEVLRIRPDIPILVCTGFSEHIKEGIITDNGISSYIAKPFTRDNFIATVRRTLDNRKK